MVTTLLICISVRKFRILTPNIKANMAAINKFLIEFITACAIIFAATRNVDAYCSIKLWNVSNSSHPQPHLVKTYSCTPYLYAIGDAILMARSYRWTNCSLTYTDPASACGPLDPFDDRSHVAVVPCAYSNCSWEEKAKNLGQANYAAFITWDDSNCSNSSDLQTGPSANISAVPVSVTEVIGRELLSFAKNPNYVVDINVNNFGEFIAEVMIIFFATIFGLCTCCCCFYTTCEERLLERCVLPWRCIRNTCLHRKCCLPAARCLLKKHRRRVLICTVMAVIVVFGVLCGLEVYVLYPWQLLLPPWSLLYMAAAVIGVGLCFCWPCILFQCCCRVPLFWYRLHRRRWQWFDRSDDSDFSIDTDDIEPVVVRPDSPIRPSYPLDIDRLAVKCTYKIGQGMNDMCAICLEEFTVGEEVRELPCLHVYHGGCVETWLNEYKHTCPLCKTPITARRKKRVAAGKSERTPLLGGELEISLSYSSMNEEERDNDPVLQLAG